MGLIGVKADASDISKNLEMYLGKTLKERLDKASKAVKIQGAELQKARIEDAWKIAVETYYNSYDPQSNGGYDRQEDFGRMMEIEDSGNGKLTISIDSGKLGAHRAEDDYLYEYMFKEGYHGGAKPKNSEKGDFLWRSPNGFFTHWGKKAVRTEAPYDIFQRILDDTRDEITEKLQNIFYDNF